jgi:hypothetical protein
LFNAQIARLVVLNEDLKVELVGLRKPLTDIDPGISSEYRHRYFLRRSVGTLREFAEALRLLTQNKEAAERLKERFPTEIKEEWDQALAYFSSEERLFTEVRNDLGGHFGANAAVYAIESLTPRTGGIIETYRDFQTGKNYTEVGFVGELTARAFVRHLPGNTVLEKYEHLMQKVTRGVELARAASDAVIWFYLWPKFGR